MPSPWPTTPCSVLQLPTYFFHYQTGTSTAGNRPISGNSLYDHFKSLLEQEARHYRYECEPNQPMHAETEDPNAGLGIPDLDPLYTGQRDPGPVRMPNRIQHRTHAATGDKPLGSASFEPLSNCFTTHGDSQVTGNFSPGSDTPADFLFRYHSYHWSFRHYTGGSRQSRRDCGQRCPHPNGQNALRSFCHRRTPIK